jgi:hypothetical protein
MQGLLLVYEFLAGIFLTVVGWVEKIGLKRRLSKGLGRRVSDQELLSISTWMRVPDKKQVTTSRLASRPKETRR